MNGVDPAVRVAGVTVAVDGQDHVSDGAGQVDVTVTNGASLATRGSAAYWDRQTKYLLGLETITLWPLGGEFRAAYYKGLVYDSFEPSWEGVLMRPLSGSFSVSVSPDIRADEAALYWANVAIEATSRLSRLTATPIGFVWAESGADVTFEIDPTDPEVEGYAGICYLWHRGHAFVRARIVFAEMRYARSNTAVHELGHFLGFNHSTDGRDIMCTSRRYRQRTEWGPGETSAWIMMAQRTPGNRFPDVDPTVAVAWTGSGETVVRCVR